jgi:uncharacterized protein YvpB
MPKLDSTGRLILAGLILAVLGCSVFTAQTPGRDGSSSVAGTAPARRVLPGESGKSTPALHPAASVLSPPDATPRPCDANQEFGADGSLLPTAALPPSASIKNMRGAEQSLPLDCEARSAVDWAGHFGVEINELEFFNKIPASDDPDKGFVGSVYGKWGNIPPHAYGVHAGPVAFLLRYYGLPAYAYRGLSWEQLRAEVAAGRPVIVWVVGHIWRSTPLTMTVTGGGTVLVAPLEHTVILTAYTETMATVLDGASRYSVTIPAFMDSWNTLGTMGIVGRILPARPDCAGKAVELVP